MKRIIRYMITCSVIFLVTFTSASAVSYLKLSYNGKNVKYTGRQVRSVTVDNKKIKLNKTKGIVINGHAMVSYKDVFKSGLGANCKYKTSNKKLTMKQNGITLQMTVGSKVIYINEKKGKLPVAPVLVKYKKSKTSKILVPSKYVAKKLGYTYQWNKSKGSITLKSPTVIHYNGKWNIYSKYKGQVMVNGKSVDLSNKIPVLSIGGTTMMPASLILHSELGVKYSYNSSTKTLNLKTDTTEIVMTMGSKTAVVNGNKVTMPAAPWVVKLKSTGKSYAMVPASFTSKQLNYYYSWDKTLKIAEIHTKVYFEWKQKNQQYDIEKYTNVLVNCSAIYDKVSKSIKIGITGINTENMKNIIETKDEANNQVHFDFPSTFNDIGDSVYENISSTISKIELTQREDNSTRLTITCNNLNGYTYKLLDNELSVTIDFQEVLNYSIKIPKPTNVSYNMVTNDDLYEKRTFTITLPGDQIAFFKTNPILSNNSAIRSIYTNLDSTGLNTIITVVTTKLQGYKLTDQGSYISVEIGNPRDIYKNIVILDAGHGGKDSGATSKGTLEKDLNYKILYTYAKKYFNASNSPVKAYWTRKDDTFIELYDRAGYANVIGADVFVSLHMNSYSTSTPNGTEVYYSSANTATLLSGLNSKTMATVFKNNLVSNLGMKDRGVQSQKYVVVHRNTVPAILIELGFISNTSDYNKLTNAVFQEKSAKIIYDSMVEIFNKYPTGR